MVSFFEAEPQFAVHRHVLELGAGPGAVGLALASTGDVSSLLLTDLESVVPLTRSNARAAAAQHASVASLTASNRLAVHALCWCATSDTLLSVTPRAHSHACVSVGANLRTPSSLSGISTSW